MHTFEHMQQQLEAEFPQHLLSLHNDQEICWRQTGNRHAKQALVLLHGISSGAASWLAVALQLQRLCPYSRILAWDMPGYGNSAPLVNPTPSAADYVQVLEQSLAQLNVQRCVLVGHSLGALIAAYYASACNVEHISQLVLISPAGGYGANAQARKRVQVREQRLAALYEQGVSGLAAAIDQRVAAANTPEVLRQWVRWNTARMQAGGYAQAVELLCGATLGKSRHKLSMPVQVWVGEHDIVTPAVACKRWAIKLGAQYATIADAGHAVTVEQANTIAQKLANFLE